MFGSYSDVFERLFLHKDPNEDVSVPCSDLSQHQIDGLRFLFTQYKKEKPGVILNYPPGCGNTVQVAIFIGAIYQKLKSPILILYESDQEKKAWLERFTKWTTITEDSIEVDAPNAYHRKQIFITNITDLGKFTSRPWSILVVKNDKFNNIFKKCQIKVEFKIWITAQDLKKDEKLLHSVYSWIYSSDQPLQKYLDDSYPPLFKIDVTHDILLDVVLKDVLFTKRNLKPFETHKRKHEPEINSVPKVSKKNKDATGTKIKRSKKYQEVPSTLNSASVIPHCNYDNPMESTDDLPKNCDDNVTKNVSVIDDRTDNYNEDSKMDVESFIRDNDPLKSDNNLNFAISNHDNTWQSTVTDSPKAEVVYTESSLSFSDAVADIIRTENKEMTEKTDGSLFINVQVVTKNECDVTPDTTTKEEVELKDLSVLSDSDLYKPEIQKVFYISSKENCSAHEANKDNQEITPKSKTQKICIDKNEQECLEVEGNGIAVQESKLKVSTNETDSSFDSKLKDLEERALRKFKGSFLDNIF